MEGASDRIRSLKIADDLFYNLHRRYYWDVSKKRNRVLKNINLKSKLKDLPYELVGHIDYLTVDEDGKLQLFNFKVTSQNPTKWPSAKREKYAA